MSVDSSQGIFVGDLSYFCTEQDLQRLFAEFGSSIDNVMIRRGKAGDTLHYGFVKMDETVAAKAIKALQGMKFMGRRLRLNLLSQASHSQSEKDKWAQIHVSFLAKNVRQQVNEEYLDSLFSHIAEVADCIVKQYRIDLAPQKQSGYGFVYFRRVEDAIQAIRTFKNKVIDGVQLDCNFSSDADAIKYAAQVGEPCCFHHRSQQQTHPNHFLHGQPHHGGAGPMHFKHQHQQLHHQQQPHMSKGPMMHHQHAHADLGMAPFGQQAPLLQPPAAAFSSLPQQSLPMPSPIVIPSMVMTAPHTVSPNVAVRTSPQYMVHPYAQTSSPLATQMPAPLGHQQPQMTQTASPPLAPMAAPFGSVSSGRTPTNMPYVMHVTYPSQQVMMPSNMYEVKGMYVPQQTSYSSAMSRPLSSHSSSTAASSSPSFSPQHGQLLHPTQVIY